MDDRAQKLATLRQILEGFNAHDLDAILKALCTRLHLRVATRA